MTSETPSQADLTALMQKIKDLENNNTELSEEKKKLLNELSREASKNQQLTQKNKEEMWKKLKTVIFPWVQEVLNGDEERAKELQEGLGRLADKGEESPLISVLCNASELHVGNVAELERYRKENQELQTKINGGHFAKEDNRIDISSKMAGKRKKTDVVDEDEETTEKEENEGMWGEMKTMLKGSGRWC